MQNGDQISTSCPVLVAETPNLLMEHELHLLQMSSPRRNACAVLSSVIVSGSLVVDERGKKNATCLIAVYPFSQFYGDYVDAKTKTH